MELTVDNAVVNTKLYKTQEFLDYLNNYYYINVAFYVGVKLRK
jgi:hypothetical protein